jgi:hypothetical protein
MKEEIETEFLLLKKENETKYSVYYKENMKCIGTFGMDVDGYYHFWLKPFNNGSWCSYELRMIADALDIINKPWDEHIKQNLK